MTRLSIVIAVLAASACEEQGGDKCRNSSAVSGTVISAPLREPVTMDLAVSGTVTAPDNATIYDVQVNGVEAMSDSNDFRTWTATIPLAVLAGASKGGVVKLTAQAFTNCIATPIDVGSTTVMLDVSGISVDHLDVAAELPAGTTYLPSTEPTSAVITISGNPEAAGASVAVTASIGTLSAPQVTISGDGTAAAVGQVLFSSMTPGTAVITATAQGKSNDADVLVIGAPTFAPDGSDIKAGSSLRVTVLTTGTIDSCQATPAAGIHVTSGAGTDLMSAPGGMDQTADGLIDIDIAVDANITASTTISCRDIAGQVGTATFSGTP